MGSQKMQAFESRCSEPHPCSGQGDPRNRIRSVAEVDPQSRLVDVGLTSMDMVNLMLGVEAEFDFTIPQSEITPENFQSIETLQRMIVAQLQPEAAA
jgi:acyl carrier protein